MQKNIELEFRTRVPNNKLKSVQKSLNKISKRKDKTNRLSVMFFGKSGSNILDIRVRVTNGKSEVVIKRGGLHSHDRLEVAQPIDMKQFIGFVDIFNLFGYRCEVAERVTENYYLANEIVVSLVKAGDIVYLEIEKLSTRQEIKKNTTTLLDLIGHLDLTDNLIKSEKEFNALCDLLSKNSDWHYSGSHINRRKLKTLLSRYHR